MDEEMARKCNRKVQYTVTLSVSIATITMGMSSAWVTPVLPKFWNNETEIKVAKDEVSWMIAMNPFGFMAGSIITGFMLDTVGRRGTLLWSALPYLIGMLIVASALQAWLLYITQFMWGCATGILSNVITLYFAEITDKEIRGNLQLVTKFAFNLGHLIMMCIGPFLSYKVLNYIIMVLPVAFLAACWWIPESPYFCLKEGRVDEARKILTKLRGHPYQKRIEDELTQLQLSVKTDMKRSSSPKELFTGRQYRKAIIIAAGLKMSQIMTGLTTIKHYLALIMKESRVNVQTETVTIIFGAVGFVVSIMPSVLADKLGRRPLLIYSFIGTGISLGFVGLYFFFMEVALIKHESLSPYGFITFTGIVLANIISTIGFQSIINIIPGEIFPMNVKAYAMTSLGIFGSSLAIIVARGYQALKDVIGLCGVFWIYATVAFLGAAFTVTYVPETKGKSLAQVQMELQGDLYCGGSIVERVDGDGLEVRELEELRKKDAE